MLRPEWLIALRGTADIVALTLIAVVALNWRWSTNNEAYRSLPFRQRLHLIFQRRVDRVPRDVAAVVTKVKRYASLILLIVAAHIVLKVWLTSLLRRSVAAYFDHPS